MSRFAPLDRTRAALRDALLRHVPADAAEADDLKEILVLVEREPACFSRRTFAPGHVTGSAFVVCRDDRQRPPPPSSATERVAAARRARRRRTRPARDGAARGGGGVRTHGPRVPLASILDVDVHEIPAGKGEPPHHHHDVRYAARDADARTRSDATRPSRSTSAGSRWKRPRRRWTSRARRALARLAKLL